jgi:hypothetical protein
MIRLHAKPFGYSSVVGGGLQLAEKDGRTAFLVSFLGTTQGITKTETEELTNQIVDLIEKAGGLLISPREEEHR